MEAHEFVCGDCESNVYRYGGDWSQDRLCSSCELVREMKARGPMTAEAEATLREILGCIIPIGAGQ